MIAWIALSQPSLAADTQWLPLRTDRADASSHLVSNWNKFEENYHPTYVVDENPATAWVEGVDGDGVGEWLSLPVSAVTAAKAVRIRIRNGYQKSEVLLVANAAPKLVTFELRAGDRVVATREAVLDRAMGWQQVVIPAGGHGFDNVRMRIDSVTPGKTYRDTCVSDVLVDVELEPAALGAYAPAIEAAKLGLAKAWIADRVAAAKAFAKGGFTSPFASTQYDCDSVEPPPTGDQVDRAIAAAPVDVRAVRDRLSAVAARADGPRYRHDPRRGGYPVPEGVWDWDAALQMLRTDQVGLLEATTGWFDRPRGEIQQVLWSGRQWSTLAIEGTPTAPTAAFGRSHEVFLERGLTNRDADWTFVWGADGLLAAMYTQASDVDDDEAPQSARPAPIPPTERGGSEVLLLPTWSADRRLTGWKGWSRGVMTEECDGAGCIYARQWTCVGM